MNIAAPYADLTRYQSFAVWVISILLVAFGFRYAKDIISYVLMELYKLVIQENAI